MSRLEFKSTGLKAIRSARAADLPLLIDIEMSAGGWFRDVDMPEIADDDPPSIADLERYRATGRYW